MPCRSLGCKGVEVVPGLACRRQAAKHTLVPLDPQTDSRSIVTLTCYTLSLVANPKYIRRVSWLDSSGDNIAIVEYIGKHVIGAPQGLCKPSDNRPYVHTPHGTMQQAASMGVQMPVKAAYKLINKFNLDDARTTQLSSTTRSTVMHASSARRTATCTATRSPTNSLQSSTCYRQTNNSDMRHLCDTVL